MECKSCMIVQFYVKKVSTCHAVEYVTYLEHGQILNPIRPMNTRPY